MLKSICILIICTFSLVSYGQKRKKERFPSYFGIVAAPVIPNNFIGAVHTELLDSSGSMTTDFHNKWGFTFGATIRIGLSKNISLETGISQVRRIYNVGVSLPDSGIYDSQKLAFVNYDVPLNALFYVKLTEKWYADASLGISITHYPSDVQDSMLPEAKRPFSFRDGELQALTLLSTPDSDLNSGLKRQEHSFWDLVPRFHSNRHFLVFPFSDKVGHPSSCLLISRFLQGISPLISGISSRLPKRRRILRINPS
ncbi:hypothetical protein [Fluviicola sp.]|uniref:hypothetical protein n=1 Tax=Fluviicola sp. TaxID=1917219 RepID=UPI003D2D7EDF